MYLSLAPLQISPIFTLELHLVYRNMESIHYSEVKAVERSDSGKKRRMEGRKDGWVGPLVWLHSQFLIGCCPGNRMCDLIYPPYTPHTIRALPYMHDFLGKSWNSSPFVHTLLWQAWLPPCRSESGGRVQQLLCWWNTLACSIFGPTVKI